ncbi:MAG: undecaprenyl/decaprenyl-phosphate alpha-N-acetylglucosaminyl 1-phosphate transferase [Pirellulales bacterium]|nr:undecaprenyl/decaprenyl-phosphate alpha-N-acetylglucosaminyl 1-phosphate transferase [Pirellulales bacterium]
MACIAGVVSYPITNTIITYAPRWGLIDRPDGHHKKHKYAVALGGGLAVFLGAVITFGVEFLSSAALQESLSEEAPFLGGLLLAGGWIVGLGLIDDRFGMKGRYKLLGQLVAALIVIASGLEIKGFSLFGYDVKLGGFSVPFTVFWLLGAINSLNLLDGIDGLATTIGIILCSTITVMALMIGQTAVAVVGAVFVGSLLGFFRFNFPPAVIYLGDAGSMLIGLVVGALAIGASLKGTATVGLAAPLAIWALPMFDSFTAIVRRKLTGRSIYDTDRGHLHHRLMALFGKNTYVLAVVAVCCAVTCAGALLSMFWKSDLLALGAVLSVLCILIATQAFGHVEFKMVMSRAKMLLVRFFRKDAHHESSFQLQGSREWNLMWQSVIEFADKMQLVDVKLDINLASIQEGFHASWVRPCKSERQERWRTEIPLFAEHHVVGRLIISGSRREGISSCQAIDQLMEMLEPLEAEIVALATSYDLDELEPVSVDRPQDSPSPKIPPPQVSVS